MRYRNIPYVVGLAGLTSCTPGYSLKTISESSAAIVVEYTHSVGGELQAAIQYAEGRCQQYGRHARMSAAGPQRMDVDRAVVTFDCVN